ncbi:methyltransferase domain-containing protein [bacterium]|nr:methyltransferase domain-containing protein [bacterium]
MPTRKQRWLDYCSQFPPPDRFIYKFSTNRLYDIRNDFAARYITGEGYEIGAQNAPLNCKHAIKVKYIDYLSRKESADKYNLLESTCVHVDILADANSLESIPSDSSSFIIANHVLEHSPNPVGALLGWLRILKTDGILFLTLPNYKANEFDFEKTPVDIAHLVEDNKRFKDNEDILSEHIYEHIRVIDEIDSDDHELIEQRYREIIESNLHTHYHVFNQKNAFDLLRYIHQQIPLEIVNFLSFEKSIELFFIIKKCQSDFQGDIKIKQERSVNLLILFKNFSRLLFAKILSKWQSS